MMAEMMVVMMVGDGGDGGSQTMCRLRGLAVERDV